MLEWKPRLMSLMIAALAIAAAVGFNHGWHGPLNNGW